MVHFIKPSKPAAAMKRTTAANRGRKSARGANGLATFAIHANEPGARNALAAKEAGTPAAKITTPPKLYYYYDPRRKKWHLAYIVEDVPIKKRAVLPDGRSDASLKDYVVDARTGKLIAALPRTPSMADEV